MEREEREEKGASLFFPHSMLSFDCSHPNLGILGAAPELELADVDLPHFY